MNGTPPAGAGSARRSERLACPDCGEPLVISRRGRTHGTRLVDGVVHRERVCRACGVSVRTIELLVTDLPGLATRWLREAQKTRA